MSPAQIEPSTIKRSPAGMLILVPPFMTKVAPSATVTFPFKFTVPDHVSEAVMVPDVVTAEATGIEMRPTQRDVNIRKVRKMLFVF